MAQQILNDGDSGAVYRGKENANFTELYDGLGVKLYDYLVFFDSNAGEYTAIIGSSNLVYGTNAEFGTLMNQVMAESPAREENMTIVVAGDVTINAAAPLLVESYTTLVILGTVQCSGGINEYIKNANATDTSIVLRGGGIIDGGITSSTSGATRIPVYFEGVDTVSIEGLEIRNSANHCVDLVDCTNFKVINCKIHGAGDDCLSVIQSENGASNSGLILGNTCYNARDDYGGAAPNPNIGASGIEIEDGVSNVIIANNNCFRSEAVSDYMQYGINVTIDIGAFNVVRSFKGILIEGNTINNVLANGIQVAHNLQAPTSDYTSFSENVTVSSNTVTTTSTAGLNIVRIKGVSVTGNSVFESGSKGIKLTSCKNATVTGNAVTDSAQAAPTGSNPGINIEGISTTAGRESSNTVVSSNVIQDQGTRSNQTFGIDCSDVDNITCIGNQVIETRGEAAGGIFYGIRYNNCGGHLQIVHTSTVGANTGVTTNGVRNQNPRADCIGADATVGGNDVGAFIFTNLQTDAV